MEIESGDVIFVEFLGSDSNWPTDLVLKPPLKKKPKDMGESQALVDLGNTDYINSTI